jgi:hypothetical protein
MNFAHCAFPVGFDTAQTDRWSRDYGQTCLTE